jgi:hypothetical protein
MERYESMSTIYGYNTRKWGQRTRYSPEKFINILIGFYDKYTNKKLEKIKFGYFPWRLSDQYVYERWHCIRKMSNYDYAPLETDEEVEANLSFINNLNIISANHYPKNPELNIYEEKHIYEIDLSSYDELLKLIEIKNCATCSRFSLNIEQEFNFTNYDYSEYNNIADNFVVKSHKEANSISIVHGNYHLQNSDLARKYNKLSLYFNLVFPKFYDDDRNFLKQIEKELKIKFQRKQFFYFYEKNGKWKTKKIEISL